MFSLPDISFAVVNGTIPPPLPAFVYDNNNISELNFDFPVIQLSETLPSFDELSDEYIP